MYPNTKILVTGALGQLGAELTEALALRYGASQVVATDIREGDVPEGVAFALFNVMDKDRLQHLVSEHNITEIYHLAAILSATGEENPILSWNINMEGLLNVLEVARHAKLNKVYWPSSIAAFGPKTPRVHTPQDTIAEPLTSYGISKRAGELWCQYYHQRFGVDVRSLRYPGLIGYKALPGGGTTDYAVDIFHKAVQSQPFSCYLKPGTALPMMYMPDAIHATISLMEAPRERITVRTSYNLQGFTFTPAEIVAAIQQFMPEFQVTYQPDFRQQIAEGWPESLNDQQAVEDWGWKPQFTLSSMAKDMLEQLKVQYA
jgi:nucleoside-diphosphate-sugar epimerase